MQGQSDGLPLSFLYKALLEIVAGVLYWNLSEHDVGNDLSAYIGVEAGSEFAALHVEFLTDDGGGELHVECLVADDEVLGVASDDGAHHVLPPLDEAVLIERGLETLLAEKLADEVAHGFGVGASHAFRFES